MEMQGKVVVVTGAGSGIGRALAQRIAENGAEFVICTDMNADNAAREIRLNKLEKDLSDSNDTNLDLLTELRDESSAIFTELRDETMANHSLLLERLTAMEKLTEKSKGSFVTRTESTTTQPPTQEPQTHTHSRKKKP